MKKRILATVLAAVSAFTLAGCGGNSDHKTGENGEVNIMLLKCGIGEEFIKVLTDDFYDETGIAVNVYSDALLDQSIGDQVKNGTTDQDIYMVNGTYSWVEWAYMDKIVDLTDLCNEAYDDGSTINGNIKESIRDLGMIGDHRFIIQVSYCPTGIVYNQDMLNDLYEKNIVDSNVFPTTWDGLVKLVKDVSASEYKWNGNKVYGMVWGNSEADLMDTFKTLWAQSDYDKYTAFFNQDTLSAEYCASDERTKALQAVYDLLAPQGGVSSTSVPKMATATHTEGYNSFLKGNALMCFSGSWFESEVSANIDEDTFNYRFAPVPALDGNDITVNINYPTEYFFIPKTSNNIENAKKFLKYMFKEENLQKMHETNQTPLAFEYDTTNLKLTSWGKDVESLLKNKQTVSGSTHLNYLLGGLRPEVQKVVFQNMCSGTMDKSGIQTWLKQEMVKDSGTLEQNIVPLAEKYRQKFKEKGYLN